MQVFIDKTNQLDLSMKACVRLNYFCFWSCIVTQWGGMY